MSAFALQLPHWAAPRLDRSSRTLLYAFVISLALHLIALAVHFRFPEARKLAAPNSLEVVFVNSKTRSSPDKPELLAQANLDGGGNTDQERRAKSPLPVLRNVDTGAEAREMRRRQLELEARQRQLVTQVRNSAPVVSATLAAQPDVPHETRRSGLELARSALALARMEAQVSRNVDDYNKRPRKQFVGARATEYRFAQYVEDWRQKVERIGNLNYPEGARGRVYGSLRLAVSIKPDGTLAGIDLERSSGYKILDAAAERIVRMGAPYASFPPDIRRDTDILVITRTWHFLPGDKVFSE